MKVGIMGAHGTGKTTLALQMASRRKELTPKDSVGILTEIARSCPYPLNHEATPEAQAWIFHTQIVRELEESGLNDIVFCDRTILDSLAYSRAAGFHGQVKQLLPIASMWLNTYGELYFLRPGKDAIIAADGFRDLDPAFQLRIDRILADWVRELKIPVIEAMSGRNNPE